MAYPYVPPFHHVWMTVRIDDISTADEQYLAPGFDGNIVGVYSALGGAIATADATLTVKIGGTAVTNGALTVAQSGSAAGDVDEAKPTGNNHFTRSDAIEVETDGASTNTVPVNVTLELQPA